MSLFSIRNQEVLLPVYRQKLPKNLERVSINDLEFLKCIGKGGSSEVYLGKADQLRFRLLASPRASVARFLCWVGPFFFLAFLSFSQQPTAKKSPLQCLLALAEHGQCG